MAFWRGTLKCFAAIEFLCRARKGLRSNLNNYVGKEVWLVSEASVGEDAGSLGC